LIVSHLVRARLLRLALAASVCLASGSGVAHAQAATHTHTVQAGETVLDIAAANGLSSATVMAANALSNPDLLQVGQTLVIPPVDGVLHTVKPGDTLADIASQYDVSSADLVTANGLDSADDLSVGEVLMVPGLSLATRAVQAAATQSQATVTVRDHPQSDTSDMYVVRDGDTLRSVAEAFNLDILSLMAMNALQDPDLIRPGSRLQVSSQPLEHVVQPGDTVGDIAWSYSVDANALLRANGLEDPDSIVTGMTLVIPLGAPASASSAPASSPGSASSSAPASSASSATSTSQSSSAAAASPAASAMSAAAAHSAPASQPAAAPQAPAVSSPKPAAAGSGAMTAMVTGYALGAGAVSNHTASGTTVHWGTVAADTHLYPFGTRLRIEGLGDTVFVVEDTGSAVRGNVFDVWCPDAAAARQLGARTRQVTILSSSDN
jgi:LysM repeat protein